MNRIVFLSLVAVLFLLIDLYIYQAIKFVTQSFSYNSKRVFQLVYWSITIICITGFLVYNMGGKNSMSSGMRTLIFSFIFINYFSKIFGVLFLMVDDVVRAGKWVWTKFFENSTAVATATQAEQCENGISRADFLVKSSLVVSAVPAVTMGFGILSGAHDYRIRKYNIALPNLPSSFHGLRIAQISDIHSGSFYNKTAVQGGVDMLIREKPDVVFFTGDLVNDTATEVNQYIDVFGKVKAPLGVYSTLGNHDYGDYRTWPSQQAKIKNLENLKQAHRVMGWDLLMNEHRMLPQGTDKIAVLGVENWGTRFVQYGNLDKAYQGSEEAAVRLLLSHDPTHWDAQVRPRFPDIDIMFAGHTHGMQFGIEVGNFKWSPAQYIYSQWAGLYQSGQQYLNVNRGYGYLVFPGRIGILPEITIVELHKA